MECFHGGLAASSRTVRGTFWFCCETPRCELFCHDKDCYLFTRAMQACQNSGSNHPICPTHQRLAKLGVVKDKIDELRQNKIDIDKQTLSFHINAILDQHRDLYRAVNAHGLHLGQIYREINLTNFGRIFAYLALACLQRDSEESVRENVR
ncbi:Hypothetical predicted protein [Paramuricea clavata]|uniref:Uncharacterized protein n=1 Tax=Paramuricea clavata TaxID=317549 RepID=A0A7D9I9R8_PARCT|nr:Hypothetical predicted protein [Paramuricea clavata]